MLMLHTGPVKPIGHKHVKPSISSMQVDNDEQGEDEHSLILVSQRVPLKPEGHTQRTPLIRSMHVPLLRQGVDWHSSIAISQLIPVNPALQSQL